MLLRSTLPSIHDPTILFAKEPGSLPLNPPTYATNKMTAATISPAQTKRTEDCSDQKTYLHRPYILPREPETDVLGIQSLLIPELKLQPNLHRYFWEKNIVAIVDYEVVRSPSE